MIIYAFSGIMAVALLIFHLLGNQGLYFAYSWYDIFMHIMGGITVGFLAYQLSMSSKHIIQFSWKNIVYAVFLIGLAWEIFEAMFGIAGAPVGTRGWYIDSSADLINDCIGALFAVYISDIVEKIRSRREKFAENKNG